MEALVEEKLHLFKVWERFEKGRWEGGRGKKRLGWVRL